MIKKLQIKFIAVNMTIVSILLILMMAVVFRLTGASIERESITMMNQLLAIPPTAAFPDRKSETIRIPYFFIRTDSDGNIIEADGNYYDLTDSTTLETVLKSARNDGNDTGKLASYDLRYLRIETPNEVLFMFADISNETSMMNHLMRTCLIISLVGFAAFLMVSIILSFWAVRPVRKSWNDQKHFIADASHELKTPLTVILTNAEQLRDPVYSAVDRKAFTDNILTEASRMRTLIERLLDLARSDAGITRESMSMLNFSELAADEAMLFEPVLFENGLELTSRLEPDIKLVGEEAALHQAIGILLDNAGKYSDRGTVVEMTLISTKKYCCLSVINVGPELSKEQQQNIFRRFYRADDARKTDGGYGLGLPIASEIVRRHRGRLTVQSKDRQNIFSIRLKTK